MNSIRLEVILNALRFALHVDENHDTRITHFTNEADEQRHFILVGREVDGLPDPIDGHLIRLNTNQLRLIHVLVGEFQDSLGQRCREQHIQAFFGAGQSP